MGIVADSDPFMADGESISKQVRMICSAPGAVVVPSTAYQSSLPPCGQPRPEASKPSTSRMARAVLVPRVRGARTKLRPEVPTRVRRTELRVDPLALDESQAVLGLAAFHQTGAVVRDVLVGRDALAGDEEAASALHPRASKRDRLTRSAGLLAAVLAMVTALSVVLVSRG